MNADEVATQRPDPADPRAAVRHRPAAIAAARLMSVMCVAFGVTQLALFEPAGAEEIWSRELAILSGVINIAAGGLALGFRVIAERTARLGPSADMFYVNTLRLTLTGAFAYCLTHLHIAGSHSSIVVTMMMIQLVMVRWFAPHRDVPVFVGLALVAGVGLLTLEATGVLPYAPMLSEIPGMSEMFLDWRWVLGDVLMFAALASPIVIVAGRLRLAFEMREDMLEERVRSERPSSPRRTHRSANRFRKPTKRTRSWSQNRRDGAISKLHVLRRWTSFNERSTARWSARSRAASRTN